MCDLSDVRADGLAAATRKHLRERYGIGKVDRTGAGAPIGVPCLYSSEKPRVELMPLTDEQRANPDHFGAREHFRLRIMPVPSTSACDRGNGFGISRCVSSRRSPSILSVSSAWPVRSARRPFKQPSVASEWSTASLLRR